MRAKTIVNMACAGKNVITPDVIEYGLISKGRAYELSEGTGFKGEELYGVTICKHENGEFINEYMLARLFMTIEEARAYIESLKN